MTKRIHMPSKENIILTVILVILGFIIYSTSLDVPFVFDDEQNISDDITIAIKDLSYNSLYTSAFTGHHGDRPLAKLSFALNYYFGGDNVFGYHLVNIIIHIITAILLYWFLILTLNTPAMAKAHARMASTIAALGTILWLVHPVQIQGVTYLVQRMTSMATMFYLLSFIFYIKGRQAESGKSCLLLFMAGLLAWGLSMASKPLGVTLPIFIIIYEWYFFQELSPSWLRKNIPLFAISVIVLLFVIFIFMGADPLQSILATYANRDFSLGERVLTEFRVIVFYLSLMLLPLAGRLNLEHDFTISHSFIDPVSTTFSLVFLIFLAIVIVISAKKHRFISFALIWFLGGLLLESSIIGLELVFEHRLYLPSMLILTLLPFSLTQITRQKTILYYWLSLPIILLCFITYNRNTTWQDIHVLQQDFLTKSPNKARVLNNLGNLFLSEGRFVEAEPLLGKAIRLKPGYVDAIYNLANLMQRTGRNHQAIYYYETVLSIYSKHFKALSNLGIIYAQRGEFPLARRYFEKALTISPNHEVALTNMGKVSEDMNMIDEAIILYRKAKSVALEPRLLDGYLNRALRKKAAQSK